MDLARTAPGIVRAIEKNGFAMLRYHTLVGAAIALVVSLLLAGAVIGPITGTVPGVIAGLSFLCLAVPGSMLARRYDWPIVAGLLAPIGLLVVFAAGANSVVRTLLQGGIRWRDDFYRLDELRKGMVR